MKKLSSLFLVTLFLVSFAIQAVAGGGGMAVGAGGETVTKKQECPPGAMCSENYMITTSTVTPQVLAPVVVTPKVVAEEKKATPEEIAEYQYKLKEAKLRDLDQTKIFSYTSGSELCIWPTNNYIEWLIANPDVVVNEKDYLMEIFTAQTTSSGKYFRNQCITTIIVHYEEEE